jgi:uncharacterized protein (DUF1499 family)
MSMEQPVDWSRAELGRLFPANTRELHGGAFGRPQVLVPLGILLVLISTFCSLLAPFGTRWGWWPFSAAVDILRWAAIGAVISTALLTAALVLRRRRVPALFGILLGLAVAGLPVSWEYKFKALPPIHDISTDTKNVPRFLLIAPLRRRCTNGSHYSGPRAAAAQARAYPDIKPLRLPVPPARAFDRALEAAREMGWMIVDANVSSLRIEATASTFWFGFKDDVIVRIAAAPQGSRIDVRSTSRFGKGDGGTNAARVRTYLKKVALL